MTFGAAESATDFNRLSNSLNESKNSLAWNVYSFQGEFRYLQVTDRWKWEFWTAITLLDFSDLSEILLENIINIIKTLSLALSCSWKPITNSIPLKKKKKGLGTDRWHPINFCPLSSNRYSVHYLGSYVLKIALFGRLRLPVSKQRLWVWIPLKSELLNNF